MQRLMAHKIIYDGEVYTCHIIELDDSGCVRLTPFDGEIHSVLFVNGTVEVSVCDGRLLWKRPSQPLDALR